MDAKPKHKVGVVEHYFNNLSVAVVNVTSPLRVGDKIRIENAHGQSIVEQTVDSMQIEHTKIAEAKPGQSVGMKMLDKVHKGNLVYKV